MLDRTRWHLRKAVFRTYRYFKHPRRLKNNAIMRWFARHFLDKRVWRPCQQTFAGGCAIGFCVSAQLIPGQIALGVILAAIFRVNIPTVVILTWISNPFTFAPIGLAEKAFGDWALAFVGDPFEHVIDRIKNPDIASGVRFAQSMYFGGVLLGLLSSVVGYALGWVSWTAVARLLHLPLHRRLHLRPAAGGPGTPPAGAGDNRPPTPPSVEV
jgi:hypothetical protein